MTFRKTVISSAIALAAVVGVIGASSANAEILRGADAEYIIVNGKILHIDQKVQIRSYTIIHKYKLFHCVSDKDYKGNGLLMSCRYNQ